MSKTRDPSNLLRAYADEIDKLTEVEYMNLLALVSHKSLTELLDLIKVCKNPAAKGFIKQAFLLLQLIHLEEI